MTFNSQSASQAASVTVDGFLYQYETIFWDFDGVIKDSNQVKAEGFCSLFPNASPDLKLRIKEHHLQNPNISRFDKIPLYLDICGLDPTADLVNEYLNRFAKMTVERVCNSEWIPGVREVLANKACGQKFFVVSAAPQEELRDIAKRLNIANSFEDILGAPKSKVDALSELINTYEIDVGASLFIGDAITDYNAASECNIEFCLRSHSLNEAQFATVECLRMSDFANV